MASPFPTDVLSFAATFMAAVAALLGAMTYWLTTHRDRVNRSRYDEERNAATLSLMRSMYEERLAELTHRLTATEGRWAEVNHLLLDAQSAKAPDPSAAVRMALKSRNPFLESLGVEPEGIAVDPKLVFVLTPFSNNEKSTYDAIRNVCHRLGLRASRGDEEFVEGPILPHIVRQILRARMVVANIGTRNPNVFYELGISQALGKPTMLVSKGAHTALPFDVRSRRILFFEGKSDLERLLELELARWMVEQDGVTE